ncbi:ribosome biogenesis GTP-binding protein YsxC [Mycoplasmopsis californica]|uniref:Probable GTP-binding protein EngB n=1 Tax=Mycoplasmopsis equigenitalium TaxID=114883 RepID=A0ABY5J1C2_9BACT|nr:ribosome biogenesis GTP-binding protein YihA/YsxC [Mycoplasmopsis equigenitalium]UUD37048.1 ribosome biogenesis GTP-binding protein YihA/YsxC [Mycoplasmopsis equigenitalium]VEU69652.1 ribosome biogenesis GTP-binding protein YsxC [Mycoplasmopsis californica]
MISFSKSAVDINSFIKHEGSEVVFWGRSNVGKSSLINAIANNKIAKTSSTPGRTQLINYFVNQDGNYIVDLPGYGYAKVNKQTQEKINKMIDEYLNWSNNIKCVFLLIDARIGFQKNDLEVIDYLNQINLPIFIVFTKIDKLNQSQKHQLTTSVTDNKLNMYLLVSALKKQNIAKLQNVVNDYLHI